MTKTTIHLRIVLILIISAIYFAACSSSEEQAPPQEPAQQAKQPEPAPEPVAEKASQPDSKRVLFAYDSSTVTPDNLDALRQHADYLKANDNVKITLEGHCDIRGTQEYNNRLGERRAKAVESFLMENGISPSRINVISYGKSRPVSNGDSDDAHAKNRRVDIVYAE